MLLSHADRARFSTEQDRAALADGWTVGWGAVLADGVVRGRWRLDPEGIVVRHAALSKRALASIAAEGRRLAGFLDAADVRLDPVSR